MSVFRENDSQRLSKFLKANIVWKFDHISRTYNQINYRSIWFEKVTIILIMTRQVCFSIFLSKDTTTLMPLIESMSSHYSRQRLKPFVIYIQVVWRKTLFICVETIGIHVSFVLFFVLVFRVLLLLLLLFFWGGVGREGVESSCF